MRTHPFVRAYMAGIFIPTLFMLLLFAAFCAARFVCDVNVPIERFAVFPLALVPNLWGVWNLLYVALGANRRLPVGLHGAILPLLLLPGALFTAQRLGVFPPGYAGALWMALPAVVIGYYLIWKYFVAFFNRMLGVA